VPADPAVQLRPQLVVAADAEQVGLAARLRHHPQPPVGAVDRVAQDPVAWHVGAERSRDHLVARDPGLGPEGHALRALGRAASAARPAGR
jgi:hypothetical protein